MHIIGWNQIKWNPLSLENSVVPNADFNMFHSLKNSVHPVSFGKITFTFLFPNLLPPHKKYWHNTLFNENESSIETSLLQQVRRSYMSRAQNQRHILDPLAIKIKFSGSGRLMVNVTPSLLVKLSSLGLTARSKEQQYGKHKQGANTSSLHGC